MDYLVVSDSHTSVSRLADLVQYRRTLLKKGENLHLIFLGDGLSGLFSLSCYDDLIVHAVRGNCDFGDRFFPYGDEVPLYSLINVGKFKVFITHGHTFGVKEDRDELLREASSRGADIVMFGHTHSPTNEYIKGGSIRGVERDIWCFNPGALSDYDGSFGNLSVNDGGFLLSHGKYHNIMTSK